jgi:heme/copper-type cytochrome/quinol oxidase subunit 4
MPNTLIPPTTAADARNRAIRTFLGGLLAVVLAAAVPVVMVAAGSIRWTKEWWIALGVAVAQVSLTAAISYVARYTHPPQP